MAITMMHLGIGDNYQSVMYANNTISKVIYEVCEMIIAEYAGGHQSSN